MKKLTNVGLVAMLVVTLASCANNNSLKEFTKLIPNESATTKLDESTTERQDGDVHIVNGEEMRQLQSLLLQAGYDPNGIDGIYGPGTKTAIKELQTAIGLPADGMPTRSLIYHLQSPADSTADSKDGFQTEPKVLHSDQELRGLFSKGTVTGEELINELLEIRKLSVAAETRNAFKNLMGEVDEAKANPLTAQKTDWIEKLKNLGRARLKNLRTTINHLALQRFMDTMLEDKSVLARETIELPSAEGLTPNQQQQVLNMAAFVIGARVANQVADEAFETLKNLEGEYNDLLRHRQKIAEVLADIVARRNEAKRLEDELEFRNRTKELRQYLSEEDLEFIDRFGADQKLADFANDFAMQNLAIRFLKGRDPELYRQYRADVDGLVGRTKAAVKAAGGAIAFGGLVMSFADDARRFGEGQDTGALADVLPLGEEFVVAAVPLAWKVSRIAVTGIVLEPETYFSFFAPKRFRMVMADGDEKDLRSASKVFSLIEKSSENDRFKDALFSKGGRGLLLAMYRSDPDTVGRMLDATVPQDMRNEFGVTFMNAPEEKEYSFVNALTNDDRNSSNRIVTHLLSRDQRRLAQDPIVGKTQQQVAANFAKWNSSQLTRLILANYQGSIDYAQMQVGNLMIRLIPSMTAVYEYESYADIVRHQTIDN